MGGAKREQRRYRRIGRAVVSLLCVALVLLVFAYLARPDLFAWGGADPPDPEVGEAPPGESDPSSGAPGPGDPSGNPELDAPEPDLDPESCPEVDGGNLLALVTKRTTLGRYAPDDLEPIPAAIIHPGQRQWRYYLRIEALERLKEMWRAAGEDGVTLTVTSAYRSYQTQEELFASYVARDGEAAASLYSARPGQSEHQLGTTVDFNTDRSAGAEQHAWLMENAHRFGFALSYPLGSEGITGFQYEPWHYRYIGVATAREWKESGLTLCVYLGLER